MGDGGREGQGLRLARRRHCGRCRLLGKWSGLGRTEGSGTKVGFEGRARLPVHGDAISTFAAAAAAAAVERQNGGSLLGSREEPFAVSEAVSQVNQTQTENSSWWRPMYLPEQRRSDWRTSPELRLTYTSYEERPKSRWSRRRRIQNVEGMAEPNERFRNALLKLFHYYIS